MPKVGKKHFAYTPAGIKEAREESSKTGTPMEYTKRYQIGGSVTKNGGKRPLKDARGVGKAIRGGKYYTV